MTEQKHTLGPWVCEEYNKFSDEVVITAADGEYICSIDCDGVFDELTGPKIKADAHLIAAAPDMLGASPRAVKMLRIAAQLIADSTAVDHSIFYDDAECDGYCVIEDCEIAADELEAAIAKAKGEAQ